MKSPFTIQTFLTYLSPKTIWYYRSNPDHKPVLSIESAHRFGTRGPIYFMRCVRCHDLITWQDGVFKNGGIHR